MALNGIQIFKLTPKKNCKECGCPLAGKTAAPQATCPLSKWTYWIKPETHY